MPQLAAGERLAQRLVRALATAGSAEAAIDAVLKEVATAHGCAYAALWSHDPASGALRLQRDWASGNETDELRRIMRRLTIPVGVAMLGRAVETRAPVTVDDIATEADFARAEVALAAGLHSAVAVPLASSQGAIGVIEFLAAKPGVPPEKLADAEMAAQQLAPYLAQLQVEDRLRVSEEESASIVSAALDCIITMDHRGYVLGFNPAAQATFGYAQEEAVGRQLAELIIPPELRQAHQRALETYVQQGRATILNRRLELVGMRADGSMLPVELTVTRLGTREPPLFAGFIRDISARRALESDQARLLTESKLASERLAFLAQAGRRMAESIDWEDTLRTVVRAAVPVVAATAVLTVVEGNSPLRVAAIADTADEAPAPGGPDDAAMRVIETGELELSADYRQLVVPLRTPAGVVGALSLRRESQASPFSHDDVELVMSFAARASLHVQNARLHSERSHIARTLQASLRPQALPEIAGADLGARFLAAGEHNEVGGDFYDLYATGEGTWGAIVGDVSGKGAEAAAVTSLARHTLRTASMLHDDPAEIVALLNRAMLAQGVKAFCTVVYARLCSIEDGGIDVHFANAGHPAPLVLHADGRVEKLDGGRGPLVGALPDAVFGACSLKLAPGDAVVLYTDGVTEVRTTDPTLGDRELVTTVAGLRGAGADEIAQAVERRAVELQKGRPRDDIAVLVVRAV